MLHLDLVQHRESHDPPSVVQGVQQWSASSGVPMFLLGAPLSGTLVQSLPRMVLPLVAVGVSYEAFSPPLHLIQHGEVALGTAHPDEWAVFHNGPHSFMRLSASSRFLTLRMSVSHP